MKDRFEVHSHTHYSNLRLLDCINRPKDLVKRALELGLSGIAITDHETLASHIELNIYQKEVQKDGFRRVAAGRQAGSVEADSVQGGPAALLLELLQQLVDLVLHVLRVLDLE